MTHTKHLPLTLESAAALEAIGFEIVVDGDTNCLYIYDTSGTLLSTMEIV